MNKEQNSDNPQSQQLNIADVSISLRDRIEEALAKYWYDTEYNLIDKQDHKKAEESRKAFRKWIDANLDLFTKQ
jgi:hypothetical protein